MKVLLTLSSKVIVGGLIVTATYGQEPYIEWSQTLGGIGDDQPSQIMLTQNKEYLIFGETTSIFNGEQRPEGDTNIFVAKMDSIGNIKWQKSLGGDCEEKVKQVLETENGYIILGQTCSPNQSGKVKGHHGKGDIWLIKIDENGEMVWQNCLGGSQADHPVEILKTHEDGFMVLGQTFSGDGNVKINKGSGDVWVCNISSEGNIIWERSFGGSDRETPVQIVPVSEGGYFILAESGSNDGDVVTKKSGINIWGLRISAQGALLWQNSIGGSKTDFAKQVIGNNNGSFIILGQTLSRNGDVKKAHGSYDIWVTKLSNLGEIIWQNALGGSKKEFAKQIIKAPRGGYLVSGYTDSFDGDITVNAGKYDVWLVKLTEEGKLDWQKSLGSNNEDFPEQVVSTKDGGFLMLGSMEGNQNSEGLFDCWAVKLNANGVSQWEKVIGGSDHDLLTNVLLCQDGGYIFTGFTRSKDGDVQKAYGLEDIWVFKLSDKKGKGAKLEGFVQDDD